MFSIVSKKRKYVENLLKDNEACQTIIEEQQAEIDKLKTDVVLLLDAIRTKIESTASFEIGMIFERERILDYLMDRKILYRNEDGSLIGTCKNLYETKLVDLEV